MIRIKKCIATSKGRNAGGSAKRGGVRFCQKRWTPRNAVELPAPIARGGTASVPPYELRASSARIVQNKLGANNAAAFDIQAVCSGFVYALSVADKMVASGALYSRILNCKDHGSCVLFGDGAGGRFDAIFEPGNSRHQAARRRQSRQYSQRARSSA